MEEMLFGSILGIGILIAAMLIGVSINTLVEKNTSVKEMLFG
jgi:hypothetical protein